MTAPSVRRHFRRQCAAAWIVLAACASPRDRAGASRNVARFDSSAPRTPVEGTAHDRTERRGAWATAGGPSPASPHASPQSVAAESAALFEQRFQTARAAINAAAHALDTLNAAARRSSAYAARFDSVRVMTIAADSLRKQRDKWKKKAVVGR